MQRSGPASASSCNHDFRHSYVAIGLEPSEVDARSCLAPPIIPAVPRNGAPASGLCLVHYGCNMSPLKVVHVEAHQPLPRNAVVQQDPIPERIGVARPQAHDRGRSYLFGHLHPRLRRRLLLPVALRLETVPITPPRTNVCILEGDPVINVDAGLSDRRPVAFRGSPEDYEESVPRIGGIPGDYDVAGFGLGVQHDERDGSGRAGTEVS